MQNLETTYMGLKLKNPLILGSSSLSENVSGVKKAEDAGFGAVVLKSIFEEQIVSEIYAEKELAGDSVSHSDNYRAFEAVSKNYYIDKYLSLVSDVKKAVDIPVIASINCTSESAWLEYAKKFENSGADAIELNYFIMPSNAKISGAEIEKQYMSVAKKAREEISLPLSIKLSWHFTSISNIVRQYSDLGFNGVVMFNHFFRPDIDINRVSICSDRLIQPKGDYAETLRWTAMMSGEIKSDVCSSTGIRDAETVIKMILAGAKAVQLTSAVYRDGYDCASKITAELSGWMEKHNYDSIEQFRGLLAQENIENPEKWERAQYMRFNKF
ncbi:MAG: dihydroorotate dehydrogenase-like protein [Sphaerochaetaceae bacterium]|nr:dihydroorotate dehydrogenase-like protein [Sphaerochaetaceae bacterium]